MRWPSESKLIFLIALCSTIFACSGGSEEEGRVRITTVEATGIYKSGLERLELKADGTFVQDLVFSAQPIHRIGRWQIVNHFLDGSEVLLLNAAFISPETPVDKTHTLAFGDIRLYVHNRSGRVALARNEVADAYYERSQ